MKVVFITTSEELEENGRIATEVKKIGSRFKLINFRNFEYGITNGKLVVENFNLEKKDRVVIRGVFRSIKAITAYIQGLKNKGLKVFDNNFLAHKYSINKISDLIKLANAGITVPDSFHLHDFQKYLKYAKIIGYPIVLKLTRTGKGAGIYKFDNKGNLKEFITNLAKNGIEAKNYLLQKYIDYKYDLRILIIGRKLFCMRRIPGEGEFRANFSLGGTVTAFDLDQAGKKLAFKALKAAELEVGGVDMLITSENKRYILEVNHTPGMIGMEAATGKNITKVYVEYAIRNAK